HAALSRFRAEPFLLCLVGLGGGSFRDHYADPGGDRQGCPVDRRICGDADNFSCFAALPDAAHRSCRARARLCTPRASASRTFHLRNVARGLQHTGPDQVSCWDLARVDTASYSSEPESRDSCRLDKLLAGGEWWGRE